ncbi:hypothetical protein OH768_46355 [Streptomyces sp. NBC_01622]|uniref:hypothetical protein n=1 Tax=Streptomyces sp. NBC_01622 TaxID=2975903 RepID=UPI003868D0E9|nr:hypothetical protein OH768_46355 [Streptomyces sp. NBC_01622]
MPYQGPLDASELFGERYPQMVRGEVDAAVVLGGPVEAAFTDARKDAFGMDGILGNAMGFDAPPTPEQLAAGRAEFSLRPLLGQDSNSPTREPRSRHRALRGQQAARSVPDDHRPA